jgi:tRNA A-37 threonylcarbamoyl transferase component Bud32
MHRKRGSEDPVSTQASGWKKKKTLIVGPLKIPKSLINPKSKSEKSSPCTIKSSRSKEASPNTRAIKFQIPSPRVTMENLTGLKLQKLSGVKQFKEDSSRILIRQSPNRASPKSFLRTRNSESTISKSNPEFHSKPLFCKEKAALIETIREAFEMTLVEPATNDQFYSIADLLGQGAFGKVMLGHHILTSKKVAIKAIDKSHLLNEHAKRKIFREVYILKKVRSNYVVKILEVFETEKNFLIVMEHMTGGDLLKYLKINGRIPEDRCKKLFFQVVLGIQTIHKFGILHRDVKLDNVLLDKSLEKIKICDFGVSKMIHKGEIITDQCGTPAYLAPEIVLDKGYEGFWSDIWSLGVLLYCMVCGTVPFKANNLQDLHKAILLGKYELPDFLSAQVKHLIKNMLMIVPNRRIPVDQIVIHQWFDDCRELFSEVSMDEETLRMNSDAMREVESFGYPRQYIMNSIEHKSLNHAYATYHLIDQK